MSRSRQLADLLDANGDVKLSNMDNSTSLPLAGGAMTGAITTNSTYIIINYNYSRGCLTQGWWSNDWCNNNQQYFRWY